jgi:DNA (cytosine-5)-methyltransferase 1
MCRLQTFPDDLSFECGRTDVQRMLGNAVPSLIAEVLAREIRRQLLGDRKARSKVTLMPPVRTPMPKPEPLKPLPAKYRSMIGQHPDHPGEGRLAGSKRWGSAKRPDPLPLLEALRASAAE